MLEDKNIRIGANFELKETGTVDEIPRVLLQEGHSYSKDLEDVETRVQKSKKPEPKIKASKTKKTEIPKKVETKIKEPKSKVMREIITTDTTAAANFLKITNTLLQENKNILISRGKNADNNTYEINTPYGIILLVLENDGVVFESIYKSSEVNKDFEETVSKIKATLKQN